MQIKKNIIIEYYHFNKKPIIKKTITGLFKEELQTNCLEASSQIFDRISKMILSNEFFKSNLSYLCNWSYNMVFRYLPPIIIGNPQIELTLVIQPIQKGKTTIVKTITGNERDLELSILKVLKDIKEEIDLIPKTEDLLTSSKYKYLIFEHESLDMLINLLFQYYQLQKDDRVIAYSSNKIIVRIKDENTKSIRNINIFDKNLELNEFERYEKIEFIKAKKISVDVQECIFVKRINNFSTAIVFEQNCMVIALSLYDKKNGTSCKSKFTFSIKNFEESFNIVDNGLKSIVLKLEKK